MMIEFLVVLFLFLMCIVLLVQADDALRTKQPVKALLMFFAVVLVMVVSSQIPF